MIAVMHLDGGELPLGQGPLEGCDGDLLVRHRTHGPVEDAV